MVWSIWAWLQHSNSLWDILTFFKIKSKKIYTQDWIFPTAFMVFIAFFLSVFFIFAANVSKVKCHMNANQTASGCWRSSVISIVVCCSPLLVRLFLIMGPFKVLAGSFNPVHNRGIVLLCHIFRVYPSPTKQSSKLHIVQFCFSVMVCSRIPCAVPGPEGPERRSQNYPLRQIKVEVYEWSWSSCSLATVGIVIPSFSQSHDLQLQFGYVQA